MNKRKIIYLASPYSHPDALMREARFQCVCRVAADLMNAGNIVISPIAHSHPIAVIGKMNATDSAFWIEQDKPLLTIANEMVIVDMPGWETSKGIAEEIKMATAQNIPITHMSAAPYWVYPPEDWTPRFVFDGDENIIIRMIRERLTGGALQYGPLDVIGDKRDWGNEKYEEALDLIVYQQCEIKRLNHYLNPTTQQTAAKAYKAQSRLQTTYCCVCVCGHSQSSAIVVDGMWTCEKCGTKYGIVHDGDLHHNTL